MKNKKTLVLIGILIVMALILFFPYVKSGILTVQYGEEFEGLQKQTNMLSDSDYLRVISYSDNMAEVFYVSNSGDLLTFEKDEEGNWKYIKWKTVWSNSGSASEFMWPYYR